MSTERNPDGSVTFTFEVKPKTHAVWHAVEKRDEGYGLARYHIDLATNEFTELGFRKFQPGDTA